MFTIISWNVYVAPTFHPVLAEERLIRINWLIFYYSLHSLDKKFMALYVYGVYTTSFSPIFSLRSIFQNRKIELLTDWNQVEQKMKTITVPSSIFPIQVVFVFFCPIYFYFHFMAHLHFSNYINLIYKCFAIKLLSHIK